MGISAAYEGSRTARRTRRKKTQFEKQGYPSRRAVSLEGQPFSTLLPRQLPSAVADVATQGVKKTGGKIRNGLKWAM